MCFNAVTNFFLSRKDKEKTKSFITLVITTRQKHVLTHFYRNAPGCLIAEEEIMRRRRAKGDIAFDVFKQKKKSCLRSKIVETKLLYQPHYNGKKIFAFLNGADQLKREFTNRIFYITFVYINTSFC